MRQKEQKADVILVCVKKYSLDSCIPFIQNISHENTIVVPVLNVYGTGAYLQEKLPKVLVTDGCIYVSANIKQAGVLLQHGEILRVFFGVREKEDLKKLNGQLDGEYKAERLLKKIAQDFKDSGIDGILSDNIKRDALTKFFLCVSNRNRRTLLACCCRRFPTRRRSQGTFLRH